MAKNIWGRWFSAFSGSEYCLYFNCNFLRISVFMYFVRNIVVITTNTATTIWTLKWKMHSWIMIMTIFEMCVLTGMCYKLLQSWCRLLKSGSLQWCHNQRDGVSNHLRLDCLLNRLFWCRSKKTSKLRVTGLCEGNSPVTGTFSAQRASNTEIASIWWRHHVEVSLWHVFILNGAYRFRHGQLHPVAFRL